MLTVLKFELPALHVVEKKPVLNTSFFGPHELMMTDFPDFILLRLRHENTHKKFHLGIQKFEILNFFHFLGNKIIFYYNEKCII